ncbi:hypothetical protein [Nocardiopsis halotolerans]|uniref:hypothetical protein n=1 Tax=Nocardiopsis halotolerans TaxID=124252 RepID=UPI000347B8A0|nr:hypothetical protein [Nocardiopsis halotolerans]
MSPRREKLTSPQTRIALARGNRPAQHLLPIPGPVDTEAARGVFRSQRRIALRTVALLSVLLFGMSGAFALFPVLGDVRPGGVPLSWLLLTVAVYPLLFGLALWHVRSAERVEDRAEEVRESAGFRTGASGERGGTTRTPEAPGPPASEHGARRGEDTGEPGTEYPW